MSTIDALRTEILSIDEQIVALIRRRIETARDVGRIKRRAGEPLQNFQVEKNVLDHALVEASSQDVDPETVRGVVELLIRAALKAQERERVRGEASDSRIALVVGGSGLMGGWFARFLAEKGLTVHSLDPRPGSWPAGEPDKVAYDVVVVATPPSAVAAVLDELGPKLAPHALLFDIASIKGEARQALERLAHEGRRVASVHPMFGPSTELLMGQNLLLIDCGSADAMEAADELFADTTVARSRVRLDQHDSLMAEVLGLAHAVNVVFNETLRRGPYDSATLAAYASTTFEKQRAVAEEVARESPSLYFEIQSLNRENAAVLDRLVDVVTELRRIVQAKDAAEFGRWMDGARHWHVGAEGPG